MHPEGPGPELAAAVNNTQVPPKPTSRTKAGLISHIYRGDYEKFCNTFLGYHQNIEKYGISV